MRRRVEYLEARPSGGGPSAGMPGNKRSSKTREPQRTQLRRGRSHGFARRRMEPTRRVVHAPESCPECGTGLSGGWVQRRREVIEIPMVPAEVIEHLIVARVCPPCRKRRLPQAPLEGEVVGRQRFGVNLLSLLVTLREDPKSPTLAVAHKRDPVVPANGASVEAERGSHRPGNSSGCTTGSTDGGCNVGAYTWESCGTGR